MEDGHSRPRMVLAGLLYLVHNHGVASAIEAKTGDEVWKARIDGDFSTSPICADGRIYFFARDSVAMVIEPGREFRKLAVNHLDGEHLDGEQLMASPAAAGNALFVRTESHLYRSEKGATAPLFCPA